MCKAAGTLTVATAQLDPMRRLPETAGAIASFVQKAAAAKADVLLLPEAALTGYDETAIKGATKWQLEAAEQEVRQACATHQIAAIVGEPSRLVNGDYNSALVIGPDGRLVARQHKMQLVPTDLGWSQPGSQVICV